MLLLQIHVLYSTSYESVYNLAGKRFEIGFKKQMLFIKQYELFQKNTHKWRVDVKFSLFLCSLGKLADSTLSVYSVYMYFRL